MPGISRSGYAYVGRGISFLLGTPWVWKMIFCPLIISLLASLVLLIVMLSAAYSPQARALENAGLASGWAWFLGFFIVIIEVVVISTIIFAVVFGQLRQNVFDKVYESKASEEAKQRMSLIEPQCCTECRGCGWLLLLKIVLSIVFIPLNIIPIIGNAAYAIVNGFYFAWDLHRDYFAAFGIYNAADQYLICQKNSFYTHFGFSALFLETLPLVSFFFMFSNSVGAALYAAEEDPALKHIQKLEQRAVRPELQTA